MSGERGVPRVGGEGTEDIERLLHAPLDPLLTDGARFRLLAALLGVPEGGGLGFGALRGLLGLTDGNLGSHLSVLVEAGYVDVAAEEAVRRVRPGRKRRSLYAATPEGRAAFRSHARALEAIIAASRSGHPGRESGPVADGRTDGRASSNG